MNKEQKKQLKETNAKIEKAFDKLGFLNNITWTPYLNELFKMNRKAEAEHRNWGFEFEKYHPNASTTSQCARLFCVIDIAKALLNVERFKIKDYLHVKKSCIYAQSLAENYRDEILKAWQDEDLNELSNFDYCFLVSPEDEKHQKKAVA